MEKLSLLEKRLGLYLTIIQVEKLLITIEESKVVIRKKGEEKEPEDFIDPDPDAAYTAIIRGMNARPREEDCVKEYGEVEIIGNRARILPYSNDSNK